MDEPHAHRGDMDDVNKVHIKPQTYSNIMEDEDRKHSFFIKLKEGWTTNVPKTLK